jgi:hypothetical protein
MTNVLHLLVLVVTANLTCCSVAKFPCSSAGFLKYSVLSIICGCAAVTTDFGKDLSFFTMIQINFRRLSIRFVKALFFLGLLWILAAILWVAIPFPLPSEQSISDALNDGKIVSHVFDILTFYPWTDPSESGNDARRSYKEFMDLEFKLHRDSQTGLKKLEIGGGDPFRIFYFDLMQLHYNVSLTMTETVKVSESHPVLSRTGDKDGINLPWFPTADATLLYWWLHRNFATTAIRSRTVPAESKVEIWPDSSWWISVSLLSLSCLV